jgi:hypothetical protein
MPSNPIHFPALDNGMLAHLPVELSIEKITRATRFPDGSLLFAASEARTRYSWLLRYENLNPQEWQRLLDFITASKRGASSFTFYDPIGNLLAQSNNLEDSIWLASPGLTVDPILDADQSNAFILTNATAQPLALSQSVSIAGPFTTCFSLRAKWAGGANFSLALSDAAQTSSVSRSATAWARHHVRLTSSGAPETRMVSIVVPPTTQIIVAAPQLEIAAHPGVPLETGAQSGVFPNSWLAQKSFDTRSAAPGAHSITLRIESLR